MSGDRQQQEEKQHVSSLLFDLRFGSEGQQQNVAFMPQKILSIIEKATHVTFNPLYQAPKDEALGKTKTWVYENNQLEILLTIRIYQIQQQQQQHGTMMATVNLDMPRSCFVALNVDNCLEESVSSQLKIGLECCLLSKHFPPLKRCLEVSPYLATSDNRITEYGFNKVLVSTQSDFQLVQIIETRDYGNLLILDGMANLAESDTVTYTHALMNLPTENYKDKNVLILGGGDGALLKELLELPEENRPGFITMVDIDEVVMDVCAEFMPSVCGEYLQRSNWNGPNYKIIAGCAIQFMKECKAKQFEFDYIFGDLTDTPVSTGPRDSDLWQFLGTILELGVGLLRPNSGRYLTHCNGINVPHSLTAYEKVLSELAGGKCKFTQTQSYVNSFMETWVFYQIFRRE